MAARKQRQRHRQRGGRFGALYKLLSFVLVFAAIIAGSIAFFKVNHVEVVGSSPYTDEEVRAASGVAVGDNLFLVNKPATAQRILNSLPYVETVSPVRRLPDTLELYITESRAVAAIQAEDSWWLLDEGGKVLEQGDESLRGELPEVLGLTVLSAEPARRIQVAEEDEFRLEGLCRLLTALSRRELSGKVSEFIDVSAINSIYFGSGDDLTVVMPMSGDLERMTFAFQRVMETFEEEGESLAGTLDLTYGDQEARLLTERWLPKGYGSTGKGGDGDGGADAGDEPKDYLPEIIQQPQ